VIRRSAVVAKRTAIAFYDDQMTHHAAALTYYCLMSLFPAALLALSLLSLFGQYPETYDAIIGYLRDVAPDEVVISVDSSLRSALQNQGRAAVAVVVGIVLAFYGMTGALEAARRALNVVFEIDQGRSFLRRKTIDISFSLVLMVLVLLSFVLVFLGGSFANDVFGFIGLGQTAADIWSFVRWPGAVAVAMLIFSLVYYVTPDVKHRGFRWITPGAALGVFGWLAVSILFSLYISGVADVGAVYGTFAGAIVLVAWLWLTNCALLAGAELNAEVERAHELGEGVPEAETLNRPARTG